jgi:hypothetical protein
MGWPLSHVAPGLLPNRLHSCWPIWNGGVRTTILCVLTNHFEWRCCSHENEVADGWRNAIGNGLRRWQPREPPDDGRLARCSLTHCRRFPLESHRSQMGLQCHVASKSVTGQQKNSDRASLQDEMACPDCSMTTNQPEVSLKRVGRILHHVQWQHPLPLFIEISCSGSSRTWCSGGLPRIM